MTVVERDGKETRGWKIYVNKSPDEIYDVICDGIATNAKLLNRIVFLMAGNGW